MLVAPATGTAQCGLTCARRPSLIRQRPPMMPSRTVCCRLHIGLYRMPPPGELLTWLGWSRLETGPRYQQNCTECHKEKARPIRSEPQESQAAPWRLQSIARRPGGIPATKRSPPNSGACHVQDSADNEERAKSHQEHSRLSICRCPHSTTGFKHPGSKTFRPSAVIQQTLSDLSPECKPKRTSIDRSELGRRSRTAAAPARLSADPETPRRRRSAAGRRGPSCLPAPPPCRAS